MCRVGERCGNPWSIGREAVKRNRLPMAVLWAAAVILVLSYYMVPAVSSVLEPVALWQLENGWLAAFLNRVVFCGLIPGLFITSVKSLRPNHVLAVVAVQTAWSGLCGIASDWMFSLNAHLFGTGIDFLTLCVKTAVCQFLWTPFFFAPAGAIVYFWMGRDFSPRRFREDLPPRFYQGLVLPNLLVNWTIWIPVTFAVNALPTPLQIQLSGLVSSLFSLVLLSIGRHRHR